ncbi:MAG: DUF2155 domain-containing protein [Litoreibacter sp.]|nr:DUF2155 domain-containing protein [Litoreibacter sp.]
MRFGALLITAALFADPSLAQVTLQEAPSTDEVDGNPPPFTIEAQDQPFIIEGNSATISLGNATTVESETRIRVSSAPVAKLRGLDKLAGVSADIQAERGSPVRYGRLTIEMGDCRYPENNPSGDAYVFLDIKADGQSAPLFSGWMVASSPALSALEHPRYDIWAIRCQFEVQEEGQEPPGPTPEVVAGESSPRPIMRP